MEELSSVVGSLFQKMISYERGNYNSPENLRYKPSPSSLKHITKNVMYDPNIVSPTFRPPLVRPKNPYLKKKKVIFSPPKK